MNFEDFILPPQPVAHKNWQLGSLLKPEIPENGVAFIWLSDFRGAGSGAEMMDFRPVREVLYQLSALDFEIPTCDLGDLVSGKTPQDSHYILQEVLSACHYKNTVPVVIGGSADFSYSLFSALHFHQTPLIYSHLSNVVSLSADGEEITSENYLGKIFSSKTFSIKNFSLLGYQKHLNQQDSVNLIREVDFEVMRLAEMIGSTAKAEPFLREADLVTVDCNVVESIARPFSVNPQVNGLNRREICAYMKDIGLSENLKSVGIHNFNFAHAGYLERQLLAQMIWYLLEGLNIKRSHPKEKSFETFWVLNGDREYAFSRDTFSDLWYFGAEGQERPLMPCAQEDYLNAKRGILNPRFLKN